METRTATMRDYLETAQESQLVEEADVELSEGIFDMVGTLDAIIAAIELGRRGYMTLDGDTSGREAFAAAELDAIAIRNAIFDLKEKLDAIA